MTENRKNEQNLLESCEIIRKWFIILLLVAKEKKSMELKKYFKEILATNAQSWQNIHKPYVVKKPNIKHDKAQKNPCTGTS